MTGALLEIDDLTVRFGGVTALAGVSLRHTAGGVVGLIGANGAGKSTLINVLSGVLHGTAGTIRLDGQDISRLPTYRIARAGVARTYQNLEIFGSLSVLDNVLVPYRRTDDTRRLRDRFGIRSADRRARGEAILAEVGLGGQSHRYAAELPYGLQRRLEIGRALATAPRLLLLDEPLAGLTLGESADLLDLLARLPGRGVTVLLVEHDVPSVLRISDRVIVLHHGTVLADGAPEHIVTDPAVRAAYLGSDGSHDD
ncbi:MULTISPECIES: ABC transporter ATP-binding protein [Actinoplanes]|uniref:ABC transporter ATP-binding protein n=1 Tax=Actinoplanes TaxID=1865 RepID=UPI0005F28FD0|nr:MULTISPECIES: ABC transporter ATP-binding protein [Actinoplanes]GLY07965.1 ABC transporter ATP-binding protein [Actinoplanes sp. NBRC 101535]